MGDKCFNAKCSREAAYHFHWPGRTRTFYACRSCALAIRGIADRMGIYLVVNPMRDDVEPLPDLPRRRGVLRIVAVDAPPKKPAIEPVPENSERSEPAEDLTQAEDDVLLEDS